VKASYKSPHGTIVSEWQRSDATGETTFTATIPANTTATVLLPTSALNSAVTSSTPSDNAVKFLKVEGGYTIYELTAAGTFSFTLVPNT
jgi:alpha-L-rhamnosidase